MQHEALPAGLLAEAEALVDKSLIAAAQAALAVAEARHAAALHRAVAADAAARDARSELSALLDRAVAGDVVEVADFVAAQRAIVAAEAHCRFIVTVVRHMESATDDARIELAGAERAASSPALRLIEEIENAA